MVYWKKIRFTLLATFSIIFFSVLTYKSFILLYMVLIIFKILSFFAFQIYWQKIVYQCLSSKESSCNSGGLQEILCLGQEDPLEKKMATHSIFLPGEYHGQRSLVGYSHVQLFATKCICINFDPVHDSMTNSFTFLYILT